MENIKDLGAAELAVSEKTVERPDDVYQIALLQSLMLGNYDGVISVGEMKKHGDIGIGTFEGVNGEMIFVNGTVYQALGDGTVVVADDEEMVAFATVSYMNADITADITVDNLDAFRQRLELLAVECGENQFYFVKAHGTVGHILVRSELKQQKPYKTLDVALATDQREYAYDNLNGIIVGIYCPDYMKGLNTPGWHLHFLSDDCSKGGHILAADNLSCSVELDVMAEFRLHVPDTPNFNTMSLTEDQSARIQQVEMKTE